MVNGAVASNPASGEVLRKEKEIDYFDESIMDVATLGAVGGMLSIPGYSRGVSTLGPLSNPERDRLIAAMGSAETIGGKNEGIGFWFKQAVRQNIAVDLYWTVDTSTPMQLMADLNRALAKKGLVFVYAVNDVFKLGNRDVSILVPIILDNIPRHVGAPLLQRLGR